jgi:8-oxo-dGTP diphosphatase
MNISAAGAIVFDPAGRLLLVLRRRDPGAGRWSVPGGKAEPGETPEQACIRETAEETGLIVTVERSAGQLMRLAPDGNMFQIEDFVCSCAGPWTARAADDAAAVGWFSRAELAELPLVDGLWQVLHDWDLLPR